MKYKKYFRKTSLKQEGIGEHFLNEIASKKPKNFLEIGVFHGVTARNVCELLYNIHGSDFKYVGLDLFSESAENANEVIDNLNESYEALNNLVASGKIRSIGLSNDTSWGALKFLEISKEKSFSKIVTIQKTAFQSTSAPAGRAIKKCTPQHDRVPCYGWRSKGGNGS